MAGALAVLEEHFAGAKADRLDGLRLDWPEGWLLVRPSNTEPIVRAIAEADSGGVCRGLVPRGSGGDRRIRRQVVRSSVKAQAVATGRLATGR